MKVYLVEYIDPRTNCQISKKVTATDKTEARDTFFEQNSSVQYIARITWLPTAKD